MKKARNESLTLAAGRLLADRIADGPQNGNPDIVTCVPMHWIRRLLRGVNSSELLAESVANRLGRPRAGLLRCQRRTQKQGTLWPAERLRNVRGAYSVSPRQRPHVEGAHVLVVDDVMTTGATANEIARILHRAGAREVSIAVVARGVGFD
jgi:predicted amidophosphoribosyltransferase